MGHTDRRGRLAEQQPFAYQTSKDGAVFISWQGRRVMVLKGKSALRFLHTVQYADEQQAQLAMARITGNFKRGNER